MVSITGSEQVKLGAAIYSSVSEGVIRDFLEIVLSGIIRDISQQDPNDLRIRKRKSLFMMLMFSNFILMPWDAVRTHRTFLVSTRLFSRPVQAQ